LSKEPIKSFVNDSLVLGILDDDRSRALKAYRKLLYEAAGQAISEIWEDRAAIEKFRNNAFKSISSILRAGDDSHKEDSLTTDIQIEEKIAELKNQKRLKTPQDITARRYLIDQLIARGYKHVEITAKLGISRDSLYRWMKK